VPVFGTTPPLDLQVYTFQNLSLGTAPESVLMFVPAGYMASAPLVYLRSAASVDNGGVTSAVENGFFFVRGRLHRFDRRGELQRRGARGREPEHAAHAERGRLQLQERIPERRDPVRCAGPQPLLSAAHSSRRSGVV
jgi:hypothetical protein